MGKREKDKQTNKHSLEKKNKTNQNENLPKQKKLTKRNLLM